MNQSIIMPGYDSVHTLRSLLPVAEASSIENPIVAPDADINSNPAAPTLNSISILDNTSSIPAFLRLTNEMIAQIESGRLKPGDTLLSTRELALQVGLSRGTVRRAYQELLDRGYTHGKPGSKTVVRELTSAIPALADSCATRSGNNENPQMLPLAAWREQLIHYLNPSAMCFLEKLSFGVGLQRLKQVMTNYLLRYKGVRCELDQLMIYANKEQAYRAFGELISKTDMVAIDESIDPFLRQIMNAREAGLASSSSDADCNVFVTTPTDEYFSGTVMPLSKRIETLRWARSKKALILEEAGECENQYCPNQLPSLFELADEEGDQVFYLYSFGKMLHPLTDITVLVCPRELARVAAFESINPSILETAVLTDLIVEGVIDSFISRRFKLYRKLRQAAYFALTVALGLKVKISPQKCAHHLVVEFANHYAFEQIKSCAEQAKLPLVLAAEFYQSRACKESMPSVESNIALDFSIPGSKVLINFLCHSPEQVTEKIKHFAFLLTQEKSELGF